MTMTLSAMFAMMFAPLTLMLTPPMYPFPLDVDRWWLNINRLLLDIDLSLFNIDRLLLDIHRLLLDVNRSGYDSWYANIDANIDLSCDGRIAANVKPASRLATMAIYFF